MSDQPAKSSMSPLAFWGIVAALIIPVVGWVIAVILFARSEIGPALAVLVASGIGVVLFLAVSGG